jgi:hypothetical protein
MKILAVIVSIMIFAVIYFLGSSPYRPVYDKSLIVQITGISNLPEYDQAYLLHGADVTIWVRWRVKKNDLDYFIESVGMGGLIDYKLLNPMQIENELIHMRSIDREVKRSNFLLGMGDVIGFGTRSVDVGKFNSIIIANLKDCAQSDYVLVFLIAGR